MRHQCQTRAHAAVLAALIGIVAPAAGQERVAVGDGTVSGGSLRGFDSEFRLTARPPGGEDTPNGRWTDRVRIIGQGDRAILERTVARYDANGVMDLWRVHLVDHATLAPLHTYQRFGPGLTQYVIFDHTETGLTAIVRQNLRVPSITNNLTFDRPVYDLSLYAILLAGFPLREGLELQMPVFGQQGTVEWETVKVTGRETVPVEGGRTEEAWVVSTTLRPWTVWLTKDPPYISKIVQRLPGGVEQTSHRVSFTAH